MPDENAPVNKPSIPRLVSLAVLVAILVPIGFLFMKVMLEFLLPLFFAVVLAVVVRPFHNWVQQKCRSHDRWAAVITTAAVLLIVLLPTTFIVLRAGREATSLLANLKPDTLVQKFGQGLARVRDVGDRFGLTVPPDQEIAVNLAQKIERLLAPLALGSVQFIVQFLFGFAIAIVALYYFLADGASLMEEGGRLLPLERQKARQLVDRFGSVTRATVSATLLAALLQGALVGIGLLAVSMPAVFLLTALATMLAVIPFVGASVVWVPCCFWLFLHDDRPLAAVLLAVYCLVIVSLADNIVKPLVLHGQANMHPLLALLSVLGGVSALGTVGILVGPLAVSFLHGLLVMVRSELDALNAEQGVPPASPPHP